MVIDVHDDRYIDYLTIDLQNLIPKIQKVTYATPTEKPREFMSFSGVYKEGNPVGNGNPTIDGACLRFKRELEMFCISNRLDISRCFVKDYPRIQILDDYYYIYSRLYFIQRS